MALEVVQKPKKFPTERVLADRAWEMMREAKVGDRFSHHLLRAKICDELPRAQGAFRRQAAKLLREQRLKIVAERGRGYVVVRPDEQVAVARREHASFRRKGKKALATVTYLQRETLSVTVQRDADREQYILARTLQTDRGLSRLKEIPTLDTAKRPSMRALLAVFETPPKKKAP